MAAANSGFEKGGDNSESSVEYDIDEDIPVKKQQTWELKCILNTTDEIETYFNENRHWKNSTRSNIKSGSKSYYYCNINGRVLVNKCPAQLCVIKESTTTNFILQRANEHNHAENEPSKKVSHEVQSKIKDFYQQGFTQRLISHKLRHDNNIPSAPTKHQVF